MKEGMMGLRNLSSGSLQIDLDERADTISACWRGKANARRPSALLAPLFEDLVARASATKKNIDFRMAELEHVNSSTIVVIVQLIKRLEEARIPIAIEYDATTSWQRMIFSALSYLSGPEKVLELRPRGA